MTVGVFSFEGEWGSGYSSDRVMGLVLWCWWCLKMEREYVMMTWEKHLY